MTGNMNELKNKILQKNILINSLSGGSGTEKDKVRVLKGELDNLLYQYYKLMRTK